MLRAVEEAEGQGQDRALARRQAAVRDFQHRGAPRAPRGALPAGLRVRARGQVGQGRPQRGGCVRDFRRDDDPVQDSRLHVREEVEQRPRERLPVRPGSDPRVFAGGGHAPAW